jgi:hypothetical protein
LLEIINSTHNIASAWYSALTWVLEK